MATTKFSTGKMREFINMVDVCKMYGIQPFHVPKDLELLMDHALRVNSISVGALQQLLTELATEVKNMQRRAFIRTIVGESDMYPPGHTANGIPGWLEL